MKYSELPKEGIIKVIRKVIRKDKSLHFVVDIKSRNYITLFSSKYEHFYSTNFTFYSDSDPFHEYEEASYEDQQILLASIEASTFTIPELTHSYNIF